MVPYDSPGPAPQMATVSPSATLARSTANQAVAKMSDRNSALLSERSEGTLSRLRSAATSTQNLSVLQPDYIGTAWKAAVYAEVWQSAVTTSSCKQLAYSQQSKCANTANMTRLIANCITAATTESTRDAVKHHADHRMQIRISPNGTRAYSA